MDPGPQVFMAQFGQLTLFVQELSAHTRAAVYILQETASDRVRHNKLKLNLKTNQQTQ